MGQPPSAEDRPLAITPARPAGACAPALGLSEHDRAAVTGFVNGSPAQIEELVEDTRRLADALAGPDGDSARIRLLARSAAACRAQQRILEALLAQRLAKRDLDGVAILNKALDGVARRMLMAVKQLGVESALQHRPSVIIKHAENVGFAGNPR